MNLWSPRQSFPEAVFPGRSPGPLPFNKTQISSGSPSNPLLFLDPLTAPPFTQSTARPDPWVLSLPPPTPFYPQLSTPSSIPDSRRPDSLYLISSSTIPSSALLSPAWTLGIQSVSPVCPLCGPREVFLPRADLLCSQPFVAPQCPRTRSHPLSPAFKTLCDLVLPTSPRLLYCSPGLAG